jgi:hypothetical protein
LEIVGLAVELAEPPTVHAGRSNMRRGRLVPCEGEVMEWIDIGYDVGIVLVLAVSSLYLDHHRRAFKRRQQAEALAAKPTTPPPAT